MKVFGLKAIKKNKILVGLVVSIMLAMTVGSFALSGMKTSVRLQTATTPSMALRSAATAGPFTVDGGTEGTDFEYASPVLTIHSGNLTISTASQKTTEQIVVDGAATITLNNVNIESASGAALAITDNATFDVNILLADGSDNILKGRDTSELTDPGSAGLQKNDSGSIGIDLLGTLIIGVPANSQGTGKLTATGGLEAAGIGGGSSLDGVNGSNITITGGVVIANGGNYAAGIGGGGNWGGHGRYITISGGSVTATGGYGGAGIGGESTGNGSNIEITGGEVTATGGKSGAGIGGGNNVTHRGGGKGTDITISGGEVTANGGSAAAGIGGGQNSSGSNITISGGVVIANGENYAAGIGAGSDGSGSDITITGGEITATGGMYGSGIGSGEAGIGSNITIAGGKVTATGGYGAAGIGGGFEGSGSNITITGTNGTVKATGGNVGAGIGSGFNGIVSSGNSLNGNIIVLATSGDTSTDAIEGFNGNLTQGIVFTRQTTSGTWSGAMYGSVTLSQDLEMLANLTVPTGQTFTVNQGVTLKIPAGMALQNDGTITVNGTETINCQGEIKTKTNFYLEDSTDIYNTGYQTYQIGAGVQKYTNLPNPDDSNGTAFNAWYTAPGGPDGGGTKVDENTIVMLNHHDFYEYRIEEEYTITVTQPENGTIDLDVDEATEGTEINFTVTPDEGYQLQEGSVTVTDADGNEIPVTEEDGKFTFTMPGTGVTIDATFEEETYEISVDQPENGTIDLDVDEATEGTEISFTVTPDEGYRLQEGSVTVTDADGNEIPVTEEDGKFTFTMPGTGVTIDATFEEETYEISVDQPENGTIDLDVDEATEGTEISFTVTPDEGYQLQEGSVTVTDADGNEIPVTEEDGKFTFTMPGTGVEIKVVFEGITHEISITQPEHGTISINSEGSKTGDEVIITVTPEEGYEIDGLPIVKTEDGRIIEVIPTGNPNEYKFIMPNGNVTIEANFVPTQQPSVDPGHGGDGSDASSKTGDPFMGGVALALLGIATTGAILTHKRK